VGLHVGLVVVCCQLSVASPSRSMAKAGPSGTCVHDARVRCPLFVVRRERSSICVHCAFAKPLRRSKVRVHPWLVARRERAFTMHGQRCKMHGSVVRRERVSICVHLRSSVVRCSSGTCAHDARTTVHDARVRCPSGTSPSVFIRVHPWLILEDRAARIGGRTATSLQRVTGAHFFVVSVHGAPPARPCPLRWTVAWRATASPARS
jgi:hypothetical protein